MIALAYVAALFVVAGSWAIPGMVAEWWPKQFRRRYPRWEPSGDSAEDQRQWQLYEAEGNAYHASGHMVGVMVMVAVDAGLLWFWFANRGF